MLLFNQQVAGSELMLAEKVLNGVGSSLEKIQVELTDDSKRKFGVSTAWYSGTALLNAIGEYEEHADSSEFFKLATLKNHVKYYGIDIDNSRGVQIGKKA